MDKNKFALYAEFRPSWQSFGVYFFGAFIFAVGPMINPKAPIDPALSQLLCTLCLAFIFLKRFTGLYRLTKDKLTVISGFPKQTEKFVDISEIRRIDLRRGLSQRFLRVAHVHIYIKDQQTPAVKLFGVKNPDVFKKILMELGADDEKVLGAFRR